MQFVTFVTRRLVLAAGGVAIVAAMLTMGSVAHAALPSDATPATVSLVVTSTAHQPNGSTIDRRGDAALQGLPMKGDPAAVIISAQACTVSDKHLELAQMATMQLMAAVPVMEVPFVSHVSADHGLAYGGTNHHVSGGGVVEQPTTSPGVMAGLLLVLVLSSVLTVEVARQQRV